MQCKNPNEWLRKNNITAVCKPSKPLVGPHFGAHELSHELAHKLAHHHKTKKTLSFGVY
jgi:hypothetical protein